MPDDTDHIRLALHNFECAEYLLGDRRFGDWVATVVFYAALHIVDAMLFSDPKSPVKHGTAHHDRKDTLEGTTHYQHIYKHYSILFRATKVARYLQAPGTGNTMVFSVYMPRDKLVNTLIRHHLWQVTKSAASFLPPKHRTQLKEKFGHHFGSEAMAVADIKQRTQ
jgi:hypothetical protein